MFLFVCLFVFIILLEEYASLSDSKCITYFETDSKKSWKQNYRGITTSSQYPGFKT